ncbi:hypothetical protein CHARACLAT_017559 [Characodon lateralis]|uniref:Uncharacterized protein n=1 Tax=Characodon lateralis TaxID=208331 RepID=A0ABU7DKI1_9TELE|nr:hypothetical protein [Characodon lateralis]
MLVSKRSWRSIHSSSTYLRPVPGGDPTAFPGQAGNEAPPASSKSYLGSPPSGTCTKNLQREAPRRYPDQMPEPPQLIPFSAERQQLYFELPPGDGAPRLISEAESSLPTEEAHFSCLYPELFYVSD